MKIQPFRYITQILYLILLFFTLIVSLKVFMILILVTTILGGAFFCGWICPFGTMQDVITNIKIFFTKKKIQVPKKIHKYALYLRYIFRVLTLIGITSIFLIDARISFLDFLSGNKISIISYTALAIFIIISFFYERFFCSYFCIQGSIYGLFGALRIFRIKRNEKTCINCKLCDKVCPMNINISENKYVNSLQCLNCFKCVDSCPKKNTLKYGLISLKKQKK